MVFRDDHHILFNRQEWELRPEARELRQTPSLIMHIERPLHDEIHRICPAVPPLGSYALQHTVRLFEPGSTVAESVDSLMMAIDKASRHYKAHRLERLQAELVLLALDFQRPYIDKFDSTC